MQLIILLVIFFIIIEIFIFLLVKTLKKNFKWIIENSDSIPNFSKNLINKYNNEIYDKKLGWDNKKKFKRDFLKSINQNFLYLFDKSGSRKTKNNFKKSKSAIFGDSYAFSRYTKDNESIQFFLEKIYKSKIYNYGVGNFGIDQVYLKIKKVNINKIKNVIFVPETVARNQSYWKHFLEFGNILAFKPKFKLEKNKLILIKDHLKKLSKNKITKRLEYLKKKDFFYENKFKKYSFSFPYTFSFIRNISFNFTIFINLIFFQITKKDFFYQKAYYQVIKRNIIESQNFYTDENFTNLLEKILLETNNYLKNKKKKIFFFVVPQLIDIKLFNKFNKSNAFFENISKKGKIKLFDLTKKMSLLKDTEKYFVEDIYGGHLNYKGNKLVSKLIYKKINFKL